MKIIVKALFSFLFIPLICSAQEIPSFDLAVNVEDKNITYTIETNIPLPIEVMIALDARGLKPTDYAIGFNERETINKSPIIFTYETKDNYGIENNFLPSGSYDAKVSFYPNWGANNGNPLARKIKDKVVGTQIVVLESYGSIGNQKKIDLKQSWGMDVSINDDWELGKFIKNLGNFQELKTKGRNPNIVKTYYFPEADMTFFISKPLNKVLMWRLGKTDKL